MTAWRLTALLHEPSHGSAQTTTALTGKDSVERIIHQTLEWKTLEAGLREELEKARAASAWQKTAIDEIMLFRGAFQC